MNRVQFQNRIQNLGDFLNLVSEIDKFENVNDIRNVTINMLADNIQNFFIALILSKHLVDTDYCKANLSSEIETRHLTNLNYNYMGFIRDGFFNSMFIVVENHIRQIAGYYGLKDSNPIKVTFEQISKVKFFNSITDADKKLFYFFCCLRNTMHNMGFQGDRNISILIEDKSSIFDTNPVNLSLNSGNINTVYFENLLLLLEQIIKLINKINNLIPKDDLILHRLESYNT